MHLIRFLFLLQLFFYNVTDLIFIMFIKAVLFKHIKILHSSKRNVPLTVIPCIRHIQCPLYYKCDNSYCIGLRHVCDTVWDCPDGQDEIRCFSVNVKVYSCVLKMTMNATGCISARIPIVFHGVMHAMERQIALMDRMKMTAIEYVIICLNVGTAHNVLTMETCVMDSLIVNREMMNFCVICWTLCAPKHAYKVQDWIDNHLECTYTLEPKVNK